MSNSNRPEGSHEASAGIIKSFTVRWLLHLLGVPGTYGVVRKHDVEGVAWSHFPLYIAKKSCSLAAVLFIGTSYVIGKTSRVYDEGPASA